MEMSAIEPCLYLVIGKDAGEVKAWMKSYMDHWAKREIVYQASALLMVDLNEDVAYWGVDGSQRGWQRQVQHARPETVILLRGWSDVRGVGVELDLLRAVGAEVVFADPFGG
jgi:hypothetical protein